MFKLLFRLVLAGVIVGAAAAAIGGVAWTRMHEPYKGFAGDEQFVEIPAGSGSAEIRRRLVDGGVVRDEMVFRAALWVSGAARRLKAGEYRFDRALTPLEVVDKLERGEVYLRRITFREGLTLREMAAVFAEREFGTVEAFLEAAADPSPIAALDPQARDLEGYLFPDTYDLPRGATAGATIRLMVDRFKAAYDERVRALAAEQGLSTRQVVTLASLIEKETGQEDERPLVAAVYRNRMRIGMPMQADPTVVYALAQAGRYDGNIRKQDLSLDSPYNTYRYPGLPPGPIAAPGKASIDAALAPAPVKYLYFVSRNNGSHVFAETLAQHNANVYEHQVLYFRRQRAESGRR
jgi:UPF0755 protein